MHNKGEPFNPDERMQRIFDRAAKQGVAMCRAILYANRDPEFNYWPDRQWEKMFIHNTEFVKNGNRDIDARTLWHYQAVVVSPNLLSTTPGVGTSYLTCFRDKNGDSLQGDKTYRLCVPANPPVKRFWAVTAYDPLSRSLLASGGNITVSSTRGVDRWCVSLTVDSGIISRGPAIPATMHVGEERGQTKSSGDGLGGQRYSREHLCSFHETIAALKGGSS